MILQMLATITKAYVGFIYSAAGTLAGILLQLFHFQMSSGALWSCTVM